MTIFGSGVPSSPSFFIELFDPSYPLPGPCLQSSSKSVGCQAGEAIKHISSLIRDIAIMASEYEDYSKESTGKCSTCPNTTTVQAVVAMWQNVTVTLTVQVSNNNQGNLVISADVTQAVQETKKLMDSIKTCSQCLVQGFNQDQVRKFKMCTPATANKSSGSGESKYNCFERGMRAAARAAKHFRKRLHGMRKKANKARKQIFQRFNDNAMATFAFFSQSLSNLNSNAMMIINIFNVQIKNSMLSIYSMLQSMSNSITMSVNNLMAQISAVIDSTHVSLNASLQNASDTVVLRALQLILKIVNATELYPCCESFANKTIEVHSTFAQDVAQCSADADVALNNIAANMSSQLATIGNAFIQVNSDADTCARKKCQSMACLTGFMWSWDVVTVYSCMDDANKKGQAVLINIAAQINATLSAAQANATAVIVAAQNCTNTKVQKALDAITQIEADFQACTQNQTCPDASTTTSSKFN